MKTNTKIKELVEYTQKILGPEGNLKYYFLFRKPKLEKILGNLKKEDFNLFAKAMFYFGFYLNNIECVKEKDERAWSNLIVIICCSMIEGIMKAEKGESYKKFKEFFNNFIYEEDKKYLIKNWRQMDIAKNKCKNFEELDDVIHDIYETYRCNFIHAMGTDYIDPFEIEIDWNSGESEGIKSYPTVSIYKFIEIVLKGIFKKFGYEFNYSNKPLGGLGLCKLKKN